VQPPCQPFQVPPVAVQRRPRQPALAPGRVQERGDQAGVLVAQLRQRIAQLAALGRGTRLHPATVRPMAPPAPHTLDSPGHAPATAMTPTDHPTPHAAPRSHLGWRQLGLGYDLFPAFGLWFLVAAIFVALRGDAITGVTWGLSLFLAVLLVTRADAVASWRRGGQSLGMRSWRLKVVAADGGPAPLPVL